VKTLRRVSLLLPAATSSLVGAAILGVALAVHHLLWLQATERAAITQLGALNRDRALIETRIRIRVNDLYLLSGMLGNTLADQRGDLGSAIRLLSLSAQKLMISRPAYAQLSVLDQSGREILRLNASSSDLANVTAAPAQELRDQSSKPCFKEAVAAGFGTAVYGFFSESEAGQAEPARPTLNISTAIPDAGNKLAAVLVLSVDGRNLLQTPKEFGSEEKYPTGVLDSSGNWLLRPARDPFSALPSVRSLQKSAPADWKRISSEAAGSYSDKGWIYCFHSINLAAPAFNYPPQQMPTVHDDRLNWKLLKSIPESDITAEFDRALLALWLGAALVFLLAVPGTWIGMAALCQRDIAREQLDKVMKTSLHGIVVIEEIRDHRGRVINFKLLLSNAAAEQLLGLPLSKLAGGTLLEDDPESKHDGVFKAFRHVAESGEPQTFEHRQLNGGEERWVQVNAAKLAERLVVSVADITERRKREEQLRESELLLQAAAQMARIGVWKVEYPGARIVWSEEVNEIHEAPPDYRPTLDEALAFFPGESRERLSAAFEKCFVEGVRYDLELEFITARGGRRWVRCIGEREIDPKGEVRMLRGVIQDITLSRDALAKEQQLSRAARAAERAKSNFLAVMSHEIRTPMNGILGFADLLAQRPLSAEDLESVRIIQESGQALLRILNDILDYSRIESGRLDIRAESFSPVALLEDTRVLMAPLGKFKSVGLHTSCGPGVPRTAAGDPGRIRQILVNLVGNALKFTVAGNVTIGVRNVGLSDGKTLLQFFVRDTGIGISGEKIAQIFEPFAQADDSISRRYGGTGLGLAISRSLAELMGGHLAVESEPGQGSLFSFTLPLEVPDSADAPGRTPEPQALDIHFSKAFPLKILVAEDDAVNMKLIRKLLAKLGYEPLTANNGSDAVAMCRTMRPDCILMDIHMPDLDGVAATREIRQLETKAILPRRTFIAALTADVLPDDRSRTLAAGVDDYLTKPLKPDALASTLRRAAESTKSNSDGTAKMP